MAGGWAKQNLRAWSHVLNALAGGDGGITFSAGCYDRLKRGSRWGQALVVFVDGLPFNGPGHCQKAWQYFVDRGVIEDPTRRPRPLTVLPPSLAGPPPKGA